MNKTKTKEWVLSRVAPQSDLLHTSDLIECASRREAILAARLDSSPMLLLNLKPGDKFWTMRKGPAEDVTHPTADTLLECAWESPGLPDGADPWPSPTTEAAADLQEKVAELWHSWLKKWGLETPTWWSALEIREHVMPARRTCPSYEGCAGTGAQIDSCDSGSGREVYCDCLAGVALQATDADAQGLVQRAIVRGLIAGGHDPLLAKAKPQARDLVAIDNDHPASLVRAAEDTLPLCSDCKVRAPAPGGLQCKPCLLQGVSGG